MVVKCHYKKKCFVREINNQIQLLIWDEGHELIPGEGAVASNLLQLLEKGVSLWYILLLWKKFMGYWLGKLSMAASKRLKVHI